MGGPRYTFGLFKVSRWILWTDTKTPCEPTLSCLGMCKKKKKNYTVTYPWSFLVQTYAKSLSVMHKVWVIVPTVGLGFASVIWVRNAPIVHSSTAHVLWICSTDSESRDNRNLWHPKSRDKGTPLSAVSTFWILKISSRRILWDTHLLAKEVRLSTPLYHRNLWGPYRTSYFIKGTWRVSLRMFSVLAGCTRSYTTFTQKYSGQYFPSLFVCHNRQRKAIMEIFAPITCCGPSPSAYRY